MNLADVFTFLFVILGFVLVWIALALFGTEGALFHRRQTVT